MNSNIETGIDSDEPVLFLSLQTPNDVHRIFKRLAKALIRLHICAGWSEPLLVAHTILLEISCPSSNVNYHASDSTSIYITVTLLDILNIESTSIYVNYHACDSTSKILH